MQPYDPTCVRVVRASPDLAQVFTYADACAYTYAYAYAYMYAYAYALRSTVRLRLRSTPTLYALRLRSMLYALSSFDRT